MKDIIKKILRESDFDWVDRFFNEIDNSKYDIRW